MDKSYSGPYFQFGQCLRNVHLTKKKINSIIAQEEIVFKNCVKGKKSIQ